MLVFSSSIAVSLAPISVLYLSCRSILSCSKVATFPSRVDLSAVNSSIVLVCSSIVPACVVTVPSSSAISAYLPVAGAKIVSALNPS